MADFPFDVVGFDLDGTLLDTAYDLGHALNHALSLAGRPTIPLEDVRSLIGGGTGQMLRGGLMRTGGIDEAELPGLTEELVSFYANNIARHTALYPGGETMLSDLESRGVKIAVATNKREALARRLFDELGLTPRLATIIGGDTLGLDRAKPKPDMLFEMVRRTGASRAAFVGDTTYDVGAAKAAGLPVVAVSFGFCDLPPRELGADAVIDHFDELIPTLEHLATA
ncbi:phosphoglycolate phosphatase [Novosphingobium nitrogenifigens DSM 19370]|uniref:phosphoglycolate phosphatase n=1 Tax=Novosphingobium nitrogenifigens DSM 19370 TaxID=983920 RepID=F1ZDM9_9SPHN|nr:HAD-IA family hydrolase [Novosphingobium nitrogenifigens]EGD57387.1 phosphoglycolate phosphatase [Novosphingobium nitrogenifigens DSM 19370]